MSVTVQPGDTLLVPALDYDAMDGDGNLAADRLEQAMPGVTVITTHDVQNAIVYRPNSAVWQ